MTVGGLMEKLKELPEEEEVVIVHPEWEVKKIEHNNGKVILK